MTVTNEKYLGLTDKKIFLCPDILKYQFKGDFNIKLSDACCDMLKKKPAKIWAKNNKKRYTLTGMRQDEGGYRNNLNCVVGDKIHFLAPLSVEWIEFFIKTNNIELCNLYLKPFNFKRTGCKGCPFSLELEKHLEILYNKLPKEYYQCINLWRSVYDEYIRIGYRLKYYPHKEINLFNIEEVLNNGKKDRTKDI